MLNAQLHNISSLQGCNFGQKQFLVHNYVCTDKRCTTVFRF